MWTDTHIWHMIRECLGALLLFLSSFHSGEVLTLPTRTVLLRNDTESWVDRYGDTKPKMALSARVLNSSSSPRLGGPFFEASPSFEETDRRRRASHPWATTFWNESTFDANGTYRPRALVIHRKSRLIGNYEKYIAHLRTLGFRVEEIFPERLPLEQQYHLGRYADLLVGMHGLGLAHGFWMDRFPIGCRSIVEFRPWVTPGLPVQLHRILGRFTGFHFVHPEPIDVTFSDNIADKERARIRLMARENGGTAWAFPEFTDQTAYYDDALVMGVLADIQRHLERCLPFSSTVNRFSHVLSHSEKLS